MSASKKYRIAFCSLGEKWSAAMIRALESLGHDVQTIDIHNIQYEQTLDQLKEIEPDFVFSRNFHIASPAADLQTAYREFFEHNPYPHATWYLDPPDSQGAPALHEMWRSFKKPKNALFFYVEANDRNFFEDHGVDSEYLGIAVDDIYATWKRDPQIEARYACDISFVGSQLVPITETPKSDEELKQVFKAGCLDHMFQYIPRFFGKLKAIEEQQFNKLYAAVANAYFSKWYENPSQFYEATQMMEAAVHKFMPNFSEGLREFTVQKMRTFYCWYQLTSLLASLQEFGLQVSGGPNWKHYFASSQRPAETIPESELIANFRASKINFCYTKNYFKNVAQERVLAVLACSGFPLTNYRSSLTEFFEKDEIVYFNSREEMLDMTKYYLKNESERLKLVQKGHEKVKQKHLFSHRLSEMVEKTTKHFGIS